MFCVPYGSHQPRVAIDNWGTEFLNVSDFKLNRNSHKRQWLLNWTVWITGCRLTWLGWDQRWGMSFRPQTSHFKPPSVLGFTSTSTGAWHLSFNHSQMCTGHQEQSQQLAPVVHTRSVGPLWNLVAKTYVLTPGGSGLPMVSQPFSVPASVLVTQFDWRRNQIDLQGSTKPLDGTISYTVFGWAVGRTFPVGGWQGLGTSGLGRRTPWWEMMLARAFGKASGTTAEWVTFSLLGHAQ